SSSLKTTKRSANWHGAALNVLGILQKNAVYNITGFVKLTKAPASPSTIKFTMEHRPAGGGTGWVTVAQGTAADDKWLELSGSYTFTEEMDALTLYAESSNQHDEFYLDNVSIIMTTPPPQPTMEKDLLALKAAVPFFIGAAVEPDQLSGVQGEMLKKHFNVLVAENVMKPGPIHPTEDAYNWGAADQLVKFAADNKMAMRFHTLQWHSQVNRWFFIDKDGNDMTAETDPGKREANKKLLLKRLEDHITAIVSRYKDKIRYWDVVNECIDASQPDGMRRNEWYLIAGKDYVETAFRAARKAGGRDVKLYINDYQTDEPKKRDALYNLVREMLAKGVPIDGVGHQCHINIDGPPVTAIADSIKKFAGLGLDNQITELDVSVYTNDRQSFRTVPRELLIKQGYRYWELFSMFRSLKNHLSCVVLWGFTDSHTWLHNRPIARRDAPFPFDELCRAKPAYWGIVDPGRLPAYAQNLNVAKGTVAVDGHADPDTQWKAVTWTPLRFSEGVEASFKALWDEQNLYLLVRVQDRSLSSGDMVEVFIDADNKKTAAYEPDDKRYEFRRDDKSPGAAYRAVNYNDGGGYQIEAKIPLAGAAVGKQIGFDLRVTDADKVFAVASWNDCAHSQNVNPSRFGTLNLAAPAALTRAVKGTPAIDAAVDPAWAEASLIETAVYVQGKGVATAKVRTMWDEDYLYVLFEVSDPLLNKANANVWEQDSVEIFIDENNAKTATYEADDAQYRVNFENLQSFGSNGQDARFKSAAKQVAGGYLVEAAVPFRTIKGTSGLMIGFDVQVNDADAGGRRQGVVTWNDPIGNDYRDTTYFGNLILAP
ncbi:MAG: endo-1,4-beta-xylanase, partial [Bacteroidota bacterium]